MVFDVECQLSRGVKRSLCFSLSIFLYLPPSLSLGEGEGFSGGVERRDESNKRSKVAVVEVDEKEKEKKKKSNLVHSDSRRELRPSCLSRHHRGVGNFHSRSLAHLKNAVLVATATKDSNALFFGGARTSALVRDVALTPGASSTTEHELRCTRRAPGAIAEWIGGEQKLEERT